MMGEISLHEALDEYKNVYLAYRNFSERTRVEYLTDIQDMIQFMVNKGYKWVKEIHLPQIERYLAELDQRKIAGTTRKRKVVSIRSFLTYLYDNGHISTNWAKRVIPPQVDSRNPRFLTEAEYTRLSDAARKNSRDFALIQLLLQTGIKLSELSNLTINDVELPAVLTSSQDDSGYTQIRGNERAKARIIPLNSKACIALRYYLENRPSSKSPALFLNRFEKRISQRGIEKILDKYLEQAQIEGASVQSLRHTFGVHHAAKGTSLKTIQELMGHKDTRSTSLYSDLAKQVKNREIQENAL